MLRYHHLPILVSFVLVGLCLNELFRLGLFTKAKNALRRSSGRQRAFGVNRTVFILATDKNRLDFLAMCSVESAAKTFPRFQVNRKSNSYFEVRKGDASDVHRPLHLRCP